MQKTAATYIRDTLRTSILRHSQRGERMNSNVKSRFAVTILRELESGAEGLERLKDVGLRGFQSDATADEELRGMRVLFTHLSKLIDREGDSNGTPS